MLDFAHFHENLPILFLGALRPIPLSTGGRVSFPGTGKEEQNQADLVKLGKTAGHHVPTPS
jgi:hypothetical protein